MLGPALAAAFLIPIGIGAPLVVGGVLKIAYDVALRPVPVDVPENWRPTPAGA